MKYRYAVKRSVFAHWRNSSSGLSGDDRVELQVFDEKKRLWRAADIDEIWRLARNKVVLERKYDA